MDQARRLQHQFADGSSIDGRDLWTGRASLRWQPTENFHTDLIWEHFQEDDDRLRSAKQLCDRADAPAIIFGQSTDIGITATAFLSQICKPVSMYSPAAFGVPNSLALPYYGGINGAAVGTIGSPTSNFSTGVPDAYASTRQSHDLRVIELMLDPKYLSKNDTLELNSTWNVTPSLTVSSETGYNRDFLWSTEDFNRFNTQPGIFAYDPNEYTGDLTISDGNYRCGDGYLAVNTTCSAAGHPGNGGAFGGYSSDGQPTGYFCDPQLGCSNRLVGEDLSEEHSWQLSQELRLSSNFDGPFNFSAGGNYMHYETEENYYVFFNTLTMFSSIDGLGGRVFPWNPHSASPNQQCLDNGRQYANPNLASGAESCLGYIDPNPLSSLDNAGHNYFLSQNPYNLNSYAAFGEAYYNVTPDLKLTAGLRFTDDQKHFVEIPSELLTTGYGYPVTGVIDQEWTEWTGRFVANWSPKLDFTDQTMLYASYAHGYKAGGANPPGAVLLVLHSSDISNPAHPATFDPEFNDAFEFGTKNTLFDGAVTLNGDVFYYDYKGYQISQIVDRTSVNLNFNATSAGGELTATWEPVPGLKFGFNGGYEHTRLADGSQAIDLMDRTAGNSDWVLVKPMVTQASNCVVPAYVVGYMLNPNFGTNISLISQLCGDAYNSHIDPITAQPYTADIPPGTQAGGAVFGAPIDPSYKGFDPLAGTPGDPYAGQNTYNGVDYGPVPNNGAGFYKNLSGNELPNAPHYTLSLTADYTVPVSPDWAATLHTDFYWQSQSWARVYNDDPYDRIHGYTNLNLALILNDSTGWQVMGYLKNVFDNTAITGSFLNSDDTGLTTNIFLTDPRLFGVRVTKRFGEGSWNDGGGLDFINDLFVDKDGGKPRVWLTVGGNFNNVIAASNETYVPDYIRPGGAPLVTGFFNEQSLGPAPAGTQTTSQLMEAAGFGSPSSYQKTPSSGFDWQAQAEFQPADSDWVLKAGIRYGRTGRKQLVHKSEIPGMKTKSRPWPSYPSYACTVASIFGTGDVCRSGRNRKFVDAQGDQTEQHTIMDFEAGVNIGIGMFGQEGQGTISGGLRVAQFKSSAHTDVNSDPEYVFTPTQQYHNVFESRSHEDRSFHGMGPEVSWEASQPFWGNSEDGHFTIDWGANAGLLFGRQSMNASHFSSYCHENGYSKVVGCVTAANYGPGHSQVKITRRTHHKVVPNLGGYIGASARYNNAKISFGYRADTFFGAMDGGQETAKDYNRGFYGPYMNVSIGLGG